MYMHHTSQDITVELSAERDLKDRPSCFRSRPAFHKRRDALLQDITSLATISGGGDQRICLDPATTRNLFVRQKEVAKRTCTHVDDPGDSSKGSNAKETLGLLLGLPRRARPSAYRQSVFLTILDGRLRLEA